MNGLINEDRISIEDNDKKDIFKFIILLIQRLFQEIIELKKL